MENILDHIEKENKGNFGLRLLIFIFLFTTVNIGQLALRNALQTWVYESSSKSLEVSSLVALVLEILLLRQMAISLYRAKPSIHQMRLAFLGGSALLVSNLVVFFTTHFLEKGMLFDLFPYAWALLVFKFGFGFFIALIVSYKLKGRSRSLPIILLILYLMTALALLLA